MRKISLLAESWLLFIPVVVALSFSFAFSSPPTPQITLPCRVISIHDGDTCTVEFKLTMHLRLLECWAPEVNKPAEREAGLRSKAKLESMAAGKSGFVTVPLFDDLGKSTSISRVLGRLTIDGKDVSEQMVAAGAATKTKSNQ